MYLSEVAVPFFEWNFEKAQVFANNTLFPQVSLILFGRFCVDISSMLYVYNLFAHAGYGKADKRSSQDD